MKLFLLSKENINLARAEAEALSQKGKLVDNVLLINTKNKTTRLAYTIASGDLIFEANKDEVKEKINKINWNKIIKGSFALFFHRGKDISHELSAKYGGMIYDLLKTPKVNLDNPKTKIIAVEANNRIYLCTSEWENEEEFYHRRPAVRPGHRPVTLLPKLARACVNLTGSTTSVYDPFCGVGAFLIEANMMGLKATGSDIDKKMIYLCKKNLEYYKVKANVFRQNALEMNKKYDYIVTDPPYGRGSKKIGKDLYLNFIKLLEKYLTKRAVIIFPNYAHAEKLIKKSKLKLIGKHPVYVHKSLTREIFVLEK